jgi:hypothetical protein
VRRLLFASLLAILFTPRAEAADVWRDPHPGIRYLHRSTNEPKEIHALIIDLSRAEISLRSTRSTEKGRTPSSFSTLVGAAAVVNGDFYNTNGSYDPVGLAIGEGMVWSDDTPGQSFVACTQAKDCQIDVSGRAVAADPSWRSAVGGNVILVRNGAVVQSAADDTACGAFCTTQHPRTAVGLSADRHTMILVVVEGRQTPILGMTTNRLAQLMLELGSDIALNLDGGGSSTMVVDGARVSGRPSNEPSERAVANHIAVLFNAAPPTGGRLVGFIRERDIFDANAGLQGVRVTLSTGQSATTDARGFYELPDVMAGDITVTAALAGYTTVTEMKTIVAGTTNWKSIALLPSTPPVPPPEDAGVAPDAELAPDAEGSPDLGSEGAVDSGASEPDAGEAPKADAGAIALDAARSFDAGSITDAGTPTAPDAGPPAIEPSVDPQDDTGCRCTRPPTRLFDLVLLTVAIVLARRRRYGAGASASR